MPTATKQKFHLGLQSSEAAGRPCWLWDTLRCFPLIYTSKHLFFYSEQRDQRLEWMLLYVVVVGVLFHKNCMFQKNVCSLILLTSNLTHRLHHF